MTCLVCGAERPIAKTGPTPLYCDPRARPCRRRVEEARATVRLYEGRPAVYPWVKHARALVARVEEATP